MKLYVLTEKYAQLAQIIADDETQSEVLGDTLQSLEDAIEAKAENIAKIIRNLDGEIEAIQSEEKRLADMKKAKVNKRNWLKDYLERELLLAGIEKVKTPIFTVAIQNNPPSVQVLDEFVIPQKYWVNNPTLDKKGILERLKAGEEIPGVALTQGKSLRIR